MIAPTGDTFKIVDTSESIHRGPATKESELADESVPLQFVDLLYAVPVADLAVRVSTTHLSDVSASGWTDVALQLTAITFGWIGHHNNRRNLPPAMRKKRDDGRQFWTWRFVQLVVEILIIVAYFALGTRAYLPHGAGIGHPSETWKVEWLTGIFVLYMFWDVLDIWIAKGTDLATWRQRAQHGLTITVIFTLIIGVGLYVIWASGYHQGPRPYHSVVVFDLVAILGLYLYRVIQEWWVGRVTL